MSSDIGQNAPCMPPGDMHGELLLAVKETFNLLSEVEAVQEDLHARREMALDILMERTGSVIAYWASGHGHPMHGQVAPLTWVPRGITEAQYGEFMQLGL